MNHVSATDKAQFYVKDDSVGSPHGLFSTHESRRALDLIDFLGR